MPKPPMTKPPSAGPTARLRLYPTVLAAIACAKSRRGTSSGEIETQAGAESAPPTPNRNVAARSELGVAKCNDTKAANSVETRATPTPTTNNRRRGSTMSVSAPAGSVNRNNGRLVATWTSEKTLGSALRFAMNQPDGGCKNAMPTFEITLADQITVKAEWPNAPKRADRGRASARDEVTSALKRISPQADRIGANGDARPA